MPDVDGNSQKVEAEKSDPTKAAAEARNGLQVVLSKASARVEQAAGKAQPYASATLWSTLIAMVLSWLPHYGGQRPVVSIPVTNTSVNPAHSTGPAVFGGGWALSQV